MPKFAFTRKRGADPNRRAVPSLIRDTIAHPAALFDQTADRHALFIGESEAHADSPIRTVITDLAAQGWEVWILDSTDAAFAGFRDRRNVRVASNLDQQIALIHQTWQQMEHRRHGGGEIEHRPLLLVLSQFCDITTALAQPRSTSPADTESQPRSLLEVAAIILNGPSVRIRVLFSTTPDAVPFGLLAAAARALPLPAPMSIGPLSAEAALTLLSSAAANEPTQDRRPGRGNVFSGNGRPSEVRALYAPDPHIHASDMATKQNDEEGSSDS